MVSRLGWSSESCLSRPPAATTAAAASARRSRSQVMRKRPGAGLLHAAHARQRRKLPGDAAAAVGFDLDGVTAAQHLAAELGHGAHQHDAAGIEQRHPVAHALHPVEQMRRQQDADALRLQRADQLEQLDARLRIEPVGRLVEDGDARRPSSRFRPGPAAGACRARRCRPSCRRRRTGRRGPARRRCARRASPAAMPISRAV